MLQIYNGESSLLNWLRGLGIVCIRHTIILVKSDMKHRTSIPYDIDTSSLIFVLNLDEA